MGTFIAHTLLIGHYILASIVAIFFVALILLCVKVAVQYIVKYIFEFVDWIGDIIYKFKNRK